MLNADFSTPSKDMFGFLKWMPIHKRLLYNKATLTYKTLNGLTPEYITNMLTPNSQVHDQPLRSSVDGTLIVPRSRTLYTINHSQFQHQNTGIHFLLISKISV